MSQMPNVTAALRATAAEIVRFGFFLIGFCNPEHAFCDQVSVPLTDLSDCRFYLQAPPVYEFLMESRSATSLLGTIACSCFVIAACLTLGGAVQFIRTQRAE
jgi:hypothetical protein